MNTAEHAVQHLTPAERSVFYDLFPPDEALEMEMRAALLTGLARWLQDSGMTEAAAGQMLDISPADVSNIQRGKISQFSLDILVRLASRAGLHPRIELKAA